MGFYSAALAHTALGLPLLGAEPWRFEAGLELGYIPWLSSERRTAGFDKPESSNLSPVLPRPRAALALPHGFVLELSWIPPVRVLDAEANLFGAALRHTWSLGAGSAVALRASHLSGRIKGAITCSEDLLMGTLADQVYYGNVCHGRPSEDYFDPSHTALSLIFSSGRSILGGRPYLETGVRRESSEFDIGVQTISGTRDSDHPILTMDATRMWASAGLQWHAAHNMRYAAEFLAAPGSLFTVRLGAGWQPR